MADRPGNKRLPSNTEMAKKLRELEDKDRPKPSDEAVNLFLAQVRAKAKQYEISQEEYVERLRSMLRHGSMIKLPAEEKGDASPSSQVSEDAIADVVDLDAFRQHKGPKQR